MKRLPHDGARRAFTLMEVLVAISLVLLLFASMFVFLNDIATSRQEVNRIAGCQRAAAALIDRLEIDLMSTLVGDQAFGPGVRGTTDRISLLTRRVAGSRIQSGELLCSEYQFNADSRLIQARIAPARRVHAEPTEASTAADPVAAVPTPGGPAPLANARPAGDSPAESAETAESAPMADDVTVEPFVPLGGTIGLVRIRYHDGTSWRDDFDSLHAGRLPAAVEVAVWFNASQAPAHQGIKESGDQGLDASSRDASMPLMFDEEAFARRSDRDGDDGPKPDRLRVIVIPDAAPATQKTAAVQVATTPGGAP